MSQFSNFSGWIADRMIAAGNSVTFTRKAMQTVGLLGPALALSAPASSVWLSPETAMRAKQPHQYSH